MPRLFETLRKENIPFIQNARMSEFTTLRVGGPADCLVHVRNTQDLCTVMKAAKEDDVPICYVGNGSNLLVLDGGIRGCVAVIGSSMSTIARDGNKLFVEAGAMLSNVAKTAMANGLSGMEEISGIPGTIGGAAFMNAGAYDRYISDIVQQVDVLDDLGTPLSLSTEALAYGYRTSSLMQSKHVVVGVTLSLSPGEPQQIQHKMKALMERRRQSQPLQLPSAGSFFKRPKGHFAGTLIEQAGLKGLSVGGAQVSEMHAGFLVNKGNATAQDFIDLMQLVQDRVQQMTGILLEPEVKIIGCNLSC